jgi:hypothetical protein
MKSWSVRWMSTMSLDLRSITLPSASTCGPNRGSRQEARWPQRRAIKCTCVSVLAFIGDFTVSCQKTSDAWRVTDARELALIWSDLASLYRTAAEVLNAKARTVKLFQLRQCRGGGGEGERHSQYM